MRDFYITNCSLGEEQAFRQHHCLQAEDLVLHLLTAKPQKLHSEGGAERSVCTTLLPQQHLPSTIHTTLFFLATPARKSELWAPQLLHLRGSRSAAV